MKKLIAIVLALVCVLGLVGCGMKNNLGDEVVEDFTTGNQDERLIEELSHLTEDELNEYIFKLHLLELTQSNIINERYPSPDDIDEFFQEALSGMTADELNEYIHRLYELQIDVEYDEAYEELSEMPANELLDLFIQNGLVINDDLKALYTEEELQNLFKENFHLWHTGVSAHSYTAYIDLAEQTKVIYDKIVEPMN